jgi:hypothetical protein
MMIECSADFQRTRNFLIKPIHLDLNPRFSMGAYIFLDLFQKLYFSRFISGSILLMVGDLCVNSELAMVTLSMSSYQCQDLST